MKKLFCFVSLIFAMIGQLANAQNYIIAIEGTKIYTDINSSEAEVGKVFKVYKEGVSAPVGMIKITKIDDSYSEAVAVPPVTLKKMSVGMTIAVENKDNKGPISKTIENASLVTSASESSENNYLSSTPNAMQGSTASNASTSIHPGNTEIPVAPKFQDERINVIVGDAQVNDLTGIGFFGTYTADILQEILMRNKNIRLLDRSILQAQMNEMDLVGNYIDAQTAIQRGRIAGAHYIIQITMQKPDVANIKTGIPLASIMGAIQAGTGKNIGAQYMSNMEVARLKAKVSITARVVDIETGEVLFMTSGHGEAQGKSQLSMEYGALSGARLNNGAQDFTNTVTGQAVQRAFIPIGKNLIDYFEGRTTDKVMGSVSGFGNLNNDLKVKGTSIYSGIEKVSMDDMKSLLYDQPEEYFNYKKIRKKITVGNTCIICGSLFIVAGVALGICFDSEGDHHETSTPFFTGALCGCASLGIGIYKRVRGQKDLNKFVNYYNMQNKRSQNNYEFNFGVLDNGNIGFCFNF